MVEVARLVMEDGKMKDCLKTSGLGGESSDDHTVLQGGRTIRNISTKGRLHSV